MIFNSLTYIAFLFIVIALYWLLPRKQRLLLLFVSSLVFYGFWRFDFLLLLLTSVLVDYFAALRISKSSSQRNRRIALLVSLTINLSLLVFFKYFYFIAQNGNWVLDFIGLDFRFPDLDILLPIGISFYTFQSISYTIDVYRRRIDATKDFVLFANYVIFFPQLVAGPILRASEVIWQLDWRPKFVASCLVDGTKRIIGGLFLKVVLADNIAGFVDQGFSSDLSAISAIDTLTLSFLFGFQIYFDFAAYSHIALGTALLMGIRFPENFNFPYLASSPREFWKRWHISLSSWVRDYLYLPLMGSQPKEGSVGGIGSALTKAPTSWAAGGALFGTWALMGLWHGAAWAFVLWGLWHAALIMAQRLTSNFTKKLKIQTQLIGGWVITLPLVMLSWVPFRTQSLQDTFILWAHLFTFDAWFYIGLGENTYIVTFLSLLFFLFFGFLNRIQPQYNAKWPLFSALTNFLIMTVMILLVLVYLRPIHQFIYFQF